MFTSFSRTHLSSHYLFYIKDFPLSAKNDIKRTQFKKIISELNLTNCIALSIAESPPKPETPMSILTSAPDRKVTPLPFSVDFTRLFKLQGKKKKKEEIIQKESL